MHLEALTAANPEVWVSATAGDRHFDQLIAFKHALVLAEHQRASGALALLDGSFAETYEQFSDIPEPARIQVLLHPASVYWTRCAYRAVAEFERAGGRSDGHIAANRRAAINNGFTELLIAAAIVGGREVKATLRIDASAGISCPGSGRYFVVEGRGPDETIEVRTRRIGAEETDIHITASAAGDVGPKITTFDLPQLDLGRGRLEINARDRRFVEEWIPAVMYGDAPATPASPAEHGQWVGRAREALDVLATIDPALPFQIGTVLRCLIPVSSSVEGRQLSCSADEFFGSCQVSAPAGIELAQEIAHEFRHNVLNAILSFDPIVAGEGATEVYSPWKGRLRPRVAVLHGIYSFQQVVGVYLAWLETHPEDVRAQTQAAIQTARLEVALAHLRSGAEFTSFGAGFVDAIETRVGTLIDRFPGSAAHLLNAARAQVSGRIS